MKVLIVSTLYYPYVLGGAEISTQLLAEGFQREGHDVTVLTTGNNYQEEIINSVKVVRIKNRNIYWRYPQRDKALIRKAIWHLIDIFNLFYFIDILKKIKKIKPDIIHTGNLCGLSVIVWYIGKMLNFPIVHTLRDYYLICPYQTMTKNGHKCNSQCKLCKVYSYFKKGASQKVDTVVGISTFILEEHLSRNYFSNSHYKELIPNSIKRTDAVQSGRSNKTIGYLGRISSEKGIEFLIDSFLESKHRGKELLIAGDGNDKYLQSLKEKYKSKSIRFLGTVKSEEFLSQIDLLVVPSMWNEPFGRVVIEAYSFGCPVFIADNGGLKELHNNKFSRLFSTNNRSDLIFLLDNFFNNKISFEFSNLDREMDKYYETSVVKSYVTIFSKLLESRLTRGILS